MMCHCVTLSDPAFRDVSSGSLKLQGNQQVLQISSPRPPTGRAGCLQAHGWWEELPYPKNEPCNKSVFLLLLNKKITLYLSSLKQQLLFCYYNSQFYW